MTDQIADLLVRLRNAGLVQKHTVILPFSKMKESILNILKKEGYISEVKIIEKNNIKQIETKFGERNITHLKQISHQGQRIYCKSKDIPKPLRGLGLVIISTPKGVITGKDARKLGVGGELICEIW